MPAWTKVRGQPQITGLFVRKKPLWAAGARGTIPAAVQLIDWYMFIAAHVVLAACVVVLLRKQSWKQYPVFFAYVILQLVSFLVAYTLDHLLLRSLISGTTYRWVSVYADVISTAVELAVLYEIANKLILSRSVLGATLRPLLRWSGAVLLLIAAAVSVFVANPGLDRVLNVFEMLNFASHLITVGILFVLLVFSHALQVPWRSLSAGLALGFGIASGSEMASSALVSALGPRSLLPADVIRVSAWLLSTTVWLVYILLPDRAVALSLIRLGKSEIEFWDHELQRMVER